jgi:quercetin dioxygenase-like cupin family protein
VTDDPTPSTTIPPDDPARRLTVARPDEDQSLPHLGLVGDTYTILVAGSDTNGRYTLIDMHVPPGGGPPTHRHDFEEMFTVLDGEVEVTFRGESIRARVGETINVPANGPHGFRNAGQGPRGCCASVPRPARTSSSPSSGNPWLPVPRRRRRWARRPRLPSSPRCDHWRRDTAPSSCHRRGATLEVRTLL